MLPKVLVALGGAWCDPAHVIGIDTSFDDEDPGWPNVKVTLDTGQVLYGMRPAEKVVRACRRPELDDYDEEADREADGTVPLTSAERARRRTQAPATGNGPSPLRPLE